MLGPRGSARPAHTQQEGTNSHTATFPSLPKLGRLITWGHSAIPSHPVLISASRAPLISGSSLLSPRPSPFLQLQPYGPANPISAQEPEVPEVSHPEQNPLLQEHRTTMHLISGGSACRQ